MKIVFGIPVRSGEDDIAYLNEILIPLLHRTVPGCKVHIMQTKKSKLDVKSDSLSVAPFDNYRFGGTCCFDNLWHLMSHIVERYERFDYFVRLDSDMLILNPDWWTKAEKDLQTEPGLLARCTHRRREPKDIGPILSFMTPINIAVYGCFMAFHQNTVDKILRLLEHYNGSEELLFSIADDAAISYLQPLIGFEIKNTNVKIELSSGPNDAMSTCDADFWHPIKGKHYRDPEINHMVNKIKDRCV